MISLKNLTATNVIIGTAGTPPPPTPSPPPPFISLFWAEFVRDIHTLRNPVYRSTETISLADLGNTTLVLGQDDYGVLANYYTIDYSSIPNFTSQFSQMCIDSAGYVIVATYVTTTELGIDTIVPIISKFDSAGNLQWSQKITNPDGYSRSVSYITVSASDQIMVTLYVVNQADSYALIGTSIAALDSSGTFLWEKMLTGIVDELLFYHVATDHAGNTYLFGDWTVGPGDYRLWIAKIDNTGAFYWQKGINKIYTTGIIQDLSVTFDASDNMYVTGRDAGSGHNQGFIFSADTNGTVLWSYLIDNTTGDFSLGAGIAYNPDDHFIYATGYNQDANFVIKLDAAGTIQWNTSYSSLNFVYGFIPTGIISRDYYYQVVGQGNSFVTENNVGFAMRQNTDGTSYRTFILDTDQITYSTNVVTFPSGSFSNDTDGTFTFTDVTGTTVETASPTITLSPTLYAGGTSVNNTINFFSPPPPADTEYWAEYVRGVTPHRGTTPKIIGEDIINVGLNSPAATPITYTTYKQDLLGVPIFSSTFDYSAFSSFQNLALPVMDIDGSGNTYTLIGVVGASSVIFSSVNKLDSTGALVWSYYFTHIDSGEYLPTSIIYNGGFVYVSSGDQSGFGPIISKIDATDGSLIWNKKFFYTGGTTFLTLTKIYTDSAGNLILAAQKFTSVPDIARTVWVAKIDTDGAIIWQNEINSPQISTASVITSVEIDESDNIYVSALTFGDFTGTVFKLDSSGNVLWSFIPEGKSVSALKYFGNALYLTGQPTSDGSMYTAKVNATTGLLIWCNHYSTTNPLSGINFGTIDATTDFYTYTGYVSNDSTNLTLTLRQRVDGIANGFTLDRVPYTVDGNPITLLAAGVVVVGVDAAEVTDYGQTLIEFLPAYTASTPNIGIEWTNIPPPNFSPPPPAATEYWADYQRYAYPFDTHSVKITSGDEIYTFSIDPRTGNDVVLRQTSFGVPTLQVTYNYGSLGAINPIDIAYDEFGNIYTVHSLLSTTSEYGSIVCKATSEFVPVWTVIVQDTNTTQYGQPLSMAYSAGFLYMLVLQNPGQFLTKLVKIDVTDGSIVWSNELSLADEHIFDCRITIDASGNIKIVGSINFSTPPPYFRQIIMKLNTSGALIWQQELEFSALAEQPGLARLVSDESNNSYIIGNSATPGAFFYKLDSSGNLVWSYLVGGAGFGYIQNITYFAGSVYLLIPDDQYSFSVMKIDASSAAIIWNNRYTSSSVDNYPSAIDVTTGYFALIAGTDINDGRSNTMLLRQLTDGTTGNFALDEDTFTVTTGTNTLTAAGFVNAIIGSVCTPVSDPSTSTTITTTVVPATLSIGIESTNP